MTDPTDDLIRDQMRTTYPLGQSDSSAAATLETLRPQMKRARSRRRATQASIVVVGASLLVVGLLTVLPKFGDSTSEVNLAGTTTTTSGLDDTRPIIDEPSTTDVGPTTTASPATSASPSSTEPSSTTDPPATTDPPSTSETTATTESPGTTQSPGTTEAPGTTVPDSNIITSPCGTVEVELVGLGIALVSTDANTGFTVEVKENEPSEIEVRFESEDRRCEVHVENRDGQVWSEVDNDSE